MPRPADRRAKIELLRAAEAVFVEHGLAAAKVEDITARAGVSKGAFYLHFESKDDCWRQIIEGFVAKLAACVGLPPEGPPEVASLGDLFEQQRAHDLAVFEFCWQNRDLVRTVLAGGGGAPYAYLIDEFAERMAKQSEAWIRACVASGLYRDDIDPCVVSALMSGAYDRLVRKLIEEPRRPDLEAWSRQIYLLFTRGLFSEAALTVLDREVNKGGAVREATKSGPVPVVRSERRADVEQGGAAGSARGRRTRR